MRGMDIAAIKTELQTIFAAHRQVGLEGMMCLYTSPSQDIWRSDKGGLKFWFSETEIDDVITKLVEHYNNGKLPNSPLLLNPIIHKRTTPEAEPEPVGSGICWALGFCLGIAEYDPTAADRMLTIGAMPSQMKRGDNIKAGLKVIAFSNRILKPTPDGAVEGSRELYEVTKIDSPEYQPFYILSGVEYLSKNGMFCHPVFSEMLKKGKANHERSTPEEIASANKIDPQRIFDAATCWHSYDRHHVLFRRFGIDVPHLEDNLKYYNLCGRDFQLLDASGPQHADADTSVNFDFLVEGWVPKGAVTIIGATGGTGKSSLAHNLAVKCSIDWKEDEQKPNWLGSKINFDKAKGMCIYFSGEDGPAIVHARAKVYDPEGRANRLMFQRTDFGEGVNFPQFMNRLMKLPDVSLLVIDPARKYLTGDENDAGVVSQFFEAIEEFAIRKNAATVVVHHLVKGANPKHVREIYDMLRGSQVFIDRARVVIGMYREGPYTISGLAKNNIPPQLGMVQGERVYVREPDKLELLLLPGPEGIRNDSLSEEELEQLMAEKGLIEAGAMKAKPDVAVIEKPPTPTATTAPQPSSPAPDMVKPTLPAATLPPAPAPAVIQAPEPAVTQPPTATAAPAANPPVQRARPSFKPIKPPT